LVFEVKSIFSYVAPVSWPSCFLAWDGMRAQRPISDLGLLGVSCRQFLIGQPTIRKGKGETIEPSQRATVYVAIIEPKREFINVPTQMLPADVMIDAVQSALQNSPHALDRVDTGVVADEFTRAMVNRLMPVKQAVKLAVGLGFVGIDYRAWLHTPVDSRSKINSVGRLNRIGNGTPATLAETDDGSLSNGTASHVEFLALVLITLFPTDVSFVNFDDTSEFNKFLATRFPKPMEKKPGRLLGNADLLRKLKRGNTLSGSDQQIHSVKPLVKWDVGPLKDGSRANGEVFLTGIAAVKAALASRDSFAAGANRAVDPVRPKAGLKIEPSRFLIGKHFEQLKGTYGDFVVHGFDLRL
jgi:hypothetical protein